MPKTNGRRLDSWITRCIILNLCALSFQTRPPEQPAVADGFGSSAPDFELRGGLLGHLHVNSESTQNINPGEDTPEKGGVESQRDTARYLQGDRGARARSISSWISEPTTSRSVV